MEHTEWEEQSEAQQAGSQSVGPTQPMVAKTKYSFTGYKYMTSAAVQGAARSPHRHLYRHGRTQPDGHAQQHEADHAMEPTSHADHQIELQSHTDIHLNGDVEEVSQHAVAETQRPIDNDNHSSGRNQVQDAGPSSGTLEKDNSGNSTHQMAEQQQQHQHPRRFKVIDFGHADLEPTQAGSPGFTETK